MKMLSTLTAAASVALFASQAQAATFLLEGPGDASFEFMIADSPTPDVVDPGFSFTVWDIPADSVSGLIDVTFYNGDALGGLMVLDFFAFETLYNLIGPQLYTGPEAEPTFLAGTYDLEDFDGNTYSLTITLDAAVVPEPSTWAMLIGGVGMAGGALRRRQTVKVRYQAA